MLGALAHLEDSTLFCMHFDLFWVTEVYNVKDQKYPCYDIDEKWWNGGRFCLKRHDGEL